MSLSIIILAAGHGTRMKSDLPKVLHKLAGRTLLEHVYISASRLDYKDINIVYGHGGQKVPDTLSHLQARWIEQEKQLGTGHAVSQALGSIQKTGKVLILYGDIPLITFETLSALVEASVETGFSLLTTYIDNPAGYGRIIRDDVGNLVKIVEEKDANDAQRTICEINTGIMTVDAALLHDWLQKLGNDNAQGEYYLTDIIEMAVQQGVQVNNIKSGSVMEVKGINDRAQLSELERYYQIIQAHHLMKHGVTLIDPARFDLRGDLMTGEDVEFDVNVIIEGSVSIGKNVKVGSNCYINNADINDGSIILPNSYIENAVIGRNCKIGPFARIRPESRLDDNVHIGNFVEIKKTEVGEGTKINHLSYVGDSSLGKNINIGAGTITCNYDGANKHKTVIEDDVFIGSDTQLVAPVTVKKGATIGAGTTVTRDIETGELMHNKIEHRSVSNWKRPVKK
ncbi:MAG: bifunctional UDP-N-acetylglucosamine diphosphorylase/glucosamine-1-phosphate N-acetyltransferase GlmU [Gammaproteobacteria bacterium]|nr:bifunctional UDP-N-acetylglucosamine diphosphorylase/glucosamine-1-phosphate N-acetyltransferase GlmU [Gammaproteobacteria bacterium]